MHILQSVDVHLNPEEEHSITDRRHHRRLGEVGPAGGRPAGACRVSRGPSTRHLETGPRFQGGVLTRPLTDLLAVTYGPLLVLTRALEDVEDVEQALIDGSWRLAISENPAPPLPADVDVLVIGYADPDELHERAEQAERVLGREVNIRRIRTSEDPFVASVQGRPMVDLDLGEQREENREVATGSC